MNVYVIQNTHLDLALNEFLTVWKKQHDSKKYLQICEKKMPEKRSPHFKYYKHVCNLVL